MTTGKTSGGATSRGKHVPQRRCVVCGERDAKRTLVRLVRTSEGGVAIDTTGKASGRGAYVCGPACAESGVIKGRIEYALRARLSSDRRQALRDSLAAHFA